MRFSRELRAIFAILAVFTAGALGYRALFGDAFVERFQIVSVSGDVRHVQANGEAGVAREGEKLAEGDRIVSGNGGRALLGLGDSTRVAVDSTTQVKVLGITGDGVKLELEGGRVKATVRPDSGSVGIVSGGREVSAADADFTVVRDDAGTLAVASERGTLQIGGPDGTTELRAGEEWLAGAGSSPLKGPASEALLLQVAALSPARTREEEVELSGTTQPGATVTVKGGARPITARADAKGAFTVRVPLREGPNELAVKAASLLGREVEVQAATITKDTTAPSVGVTIRL